MINLAIIPARSGSKGIKDKNIKVLAGKPLMAYSIETAIESGLFQEIMVSTDSEKYACIARKYGAKVPFLRSQRNSGDTASTWDTIIEIINEYGKNGIVFDSFCLLQPTSPLRTSDDIIKAYDLFKIKKAYSVVSMTELEYPIDWCGKIGADLSIDGFVGRDDISQRQTKPVYYRPNGAIYIADIQEFLKDQFLYRKRGYAYLMPKERSVDIDTEYEFNYVEYFMKGM